MEYIKNFDFRAFLEIIKDDPRLLIFAAIGVLLLFILLVWIFSTDNKPKKRSFSPIDAPKVIDYVQRLGIVAEQGREIVDYLDYEITKKNAILQETQQNVELLRQEKNQIEQALQMYQEQPHEYISMAQKAHQNEIKSLQKQARQKALKNWFIGFFIGIFVSAMAFIIFFYFATIKSFILSLS